MKLENNKIRALPRAIIRKTIKPKTRRNFDAVAFAAALEVLG